MPYKLRPDSAQIKAIERLLEKRNYRKAINWIRPLVRRLSDHGGRRGFVLKHRVEPIRFGRGLTH